MWDDKQLISLKFAPAARVTVAQLYKKYRSFEFVMPRCAFWPVLTDVDLNERARSDERVHGVIGQTHVPLPNTLWTIRCWSVRRSEERRVGKECRSRWSLD